MRSSRRATAVKSQNWNTRHFYNKLAGDADQAEWQAIMTGSAHIMAGTMDDEMAEAADEDFFPGAREEKIEGKSFVLEQVQGRAAEIILERINQLDSAYPFQRVENSLVYIAGENRLPIYELLLGISQAQSLTVGHHVKLPRIFEEVSKLAAMGFLGGNADGFHTGWPRPANVTRFKDLVEKLREATGRIGSEWQWLPGDDLPNDPLPQLIKDAGLDVVAWRNWPDRRGAMLYLLGQCACGGDWLTKDKDLHLDTLWRWFRPPFVLPVRGFFTPHHATTSMLLDLSPTAGLVFDRIRIVQCLQSEHLAPHISAAADSVREAFAIACSPVVKAQPKKRATKKVAATNSAACKIVPSAQGG